MNKVSVDELKVGNYYFSMCHTMGLKAERSGDHMQSFAPDCPILILKWKLPMCEHDIGTKFCDILATGFYGPFTDEEFDRLGLITQNSYEEHVNGQKQQG